MKNLLTQLETEEENRKITDKVVDGKVVNKKPLNPVQVLRRKINALYVRLQLRGVGFKGEVGARRVEILMIKVWEIEILIDSGFKVGLVKKSRDF